jgi:hypothetical protein
MTIKNCNTVLLLCLPLFFLMSCQSAPTSTTKVPYIVNMKAAKGATKIEITSDSQGCGLRGKKGCVECKKSKECTIELRLNLESGQVGQTCQSASPPDWVITRVELSAKGDSTTQKGLFGDLGERPDWLKNAFPEMNPQDGTLPIPVNPTQSIIFNDLNNHPNNDVKIAYYEVTASSCVATIKPIMVDPAVQNKGK